MKNHALSFFCGFSVLCTVVLVALPVAMLLNHIGVVCYLLGSSSANFLDHLAVACMLLGVVVLVVRSIQIGEALLKRFDRRV